MAMKKFIFAAVMGIFFAVLSPFKLGNAYLRCSSFDTVQVAYSESVWEIAARYTENGDDQRELVEAIIEVNNLGRDALIHTGQKLLIPVRQGGLAPKLANNDF